MLELDLLLLELSCPSEVLRGGFFALGSEFGSESDTLFSDDSGEDARADGSERRE